MRKAVILSIVIAAAALAGYADAAYYIAGDFNGWDAGSDQMADNGDGTYSYTITGIGAAGLLQKFKITDGTWGWNYPNSNSWYYTDNSGSVTVTYTPGPVDDGWLPSENRLATSTDPGTWVIAGGFQGWSRSNPDTVMSHIGNGIYRYTANWTTGSYEFKPAVIGTTDDWFSISTDNRSVSTSNIQYDVTADSEIVNIYLDSFNGVVGININVDVPGLPHDPSPAYQETGVDVVGLALSWQVPQIPSDIDPNELVADPNLYGHNVYIMDTADAEPNLIYYDFVENYDEQTLRASYTVSPSLNKDSHYKWRIDAVYDTGEVIEGLVWDFETELTVPTITGQPDHQIVDADGTATFEVTVDSPSTPTYQWYKYIKNGTDIELSDSLDISGSDTYMLTIENCELSDEGSYYCQVNNDSAAAVDSDKVMLGVKRIMAHWTFDDGIYDSVVEGSPSSTKVGEYGPPVFTGDAVSGQAAEFGLDPNNPDMIFTNPSESDYFDICNVNITVGVWIKSDFAYTWGAIVSRDGEGGEGWQLRHNGETLDSVSFTTRGVGTEGTGGPDEGRASDRKVFDGQWHQIVATYDGSVKKLYVDGVVSRIYNGMTGEAIESEQAEGVINATPAPVAFPSRVTDYPVTPEVIDSDQVVHCILDEIEIYNYALDADTIAQNYANVTGTEVCFDMVEGDITGDCIINIQDFAILASKWLDPSGYKTPTGL